MIIEEDRYLQHFGKKGMKWGVRTATPGLVGAAKTNQDARIAFEKHQRNKKILKIAAAGLALGIGAVVAKKMLDQNKAVKLSQLKSIENSRSSINRSFEIFNANSKVNMAQVRTGFAVNSRGVATPLTSNMNPFRSPLTGLL